jgi:hypothetical protein
VDYTTPSTQICPVIAAAITALRRSCNSVMACSGFADQRIDARTLAVEEGGDGLLLGEGGRGIKVFTMYSCSILQQLRLA